MGSEMCIRDRGEVAGIIDELGDGVTNYSIGEKVMAMTLFGGFSEYIIVNADALLRIPKEMDAVTAAGFTMTYGTSMYGLKQRGCLKSGEKLLVLGAGVVGLVLQLLKLEK